MRAVVYEGPNTIALKDVSEPFVKEGFTKVKIAYAGLCGGDVGIYGGLHPRAKAPLIMGHEASGWIVEGHPTLEPGTGVTINPLITCGVCAPCRTGDEHVCQTLGLYGIDADGAMADYMLVPNCRIIPLPAGMDLETGALAEHVAVVVHAIRETGYLPGDNAVIFGAGPVGLALGIALRTWGCTNLVIIEVNPTRRGFAESLGFDTVDPALEDVVEVVKSRTGGRGTDHVYDCAGHQSVAALLPQVVKVRGTIVIVALYKKQPELDMRQCVFVEAVLRFVRVYRDIDFVIAAELLQTEPDFKKLITHVLEPSEVQAGFDMMFDPKTTSQKILLKFEE